MRYNSTAFSLMYHCYVSHFSALSLFFMEVSAKIWSMIIAFMIKSFITWIKTQCITRGHDFRPTQSQKDHKLSAYMKKQRFMYPNVSSRSSAVNQVGLGHVVTSSWPLRLHWIKVILGGLFEHNFVPLTPYSHHLRYFRRFCSNEWA